MKHDETVNICESRGICESSRSFRASTPTTPRHLQKLQPLMAIRAVLVELSFLSDSRVPVVAIRSLDALNCQQFESCLWPL